MALRGVPSFRVRPSWLILSVLLGFPAWAGEGPEGAHDEPAHPYWHTNFFKRVLSDQEFLVMRWFPSEFRRPGFTVPLAMAATAAAISHDPEDNAHDFFVEELIEDGTGDTSDRIAGDLTTLGNGPTMAVILGATYLAARHAGNDRLAEASSLSAEALLNAGIWSTVLKKVSARVRPNQVGEGSFFQYGQPENGSFPSGHATGAFTVATVFAEQYREKRWVPWVAYGTATLIGTARIALGRHFPSDVVVGSVLGYSMGRAVVARAREEDAARRDAEEISLFVVPCRDGYAVRAVLRW